MPQKYTMNTSQVYQNTLTTLQIINISDTDGLGTNPVTHSVSTETAGTQALVLLVVAIASASMNPA